MLHRLPILCLDLIYISLALALARRQTGRRETTSPLRSTFASSHSRDAVLWSSETNTGCQCMKYAILALSSMTLSASMKTWRRTRSICWSGLAWQTWWTHFLQQWDPFTPAATTPSTSASSATRKSWPCTPNTCQTFSYLTTILCEFGKHYQCLT